MKSESPLLQDVVPILLRYAAEAHLDLVPLLTALACLADGLGEAFDFDSDATSAPIPANRYPH